MDRKEEEKLKNDLADAVLITAAAQKFNAVGGWEKFGGLLWGVLLVLGGISVIVLPVIVGLMLLSKQMSLQEAFEEFGAAFGIVYIFVFLMVRWLVRKLIQTVTHDPGFFDRKRSIMEESQEFGVAIILLFVVIGLISLMSGNTCWIFAITFTGGILPFFYVLPEKKPVADPQAVVRREPVPNEKEEDDDFEQF